MDLISDGEEDEEELLDQDIEEERLGQVEEDGDDEAYEETNSN